MRFAASDNLREKIMPTYEYFCSHCKHAFEESHKITAEPLKTCPKCKKDSLRRGPGGGIGLSFKGEGFYINDYGSGKDVKDKEVKEKDSSGPTSSGACGCGKTSCSA